jgi:hypothetical protein
MYLVDWNLSAPFWSGIPNCCCSLICYYNNHIFFQLALTKNSLTTDIIIGLAYTFE